MKLLAAWFLVAELFVAAAAIALLEPAKTKGGTPAVAVETKLVSPVKPKETAAPVLAKLKKIAAAVVKAKQTAAPVVAKPQETAAPVVKRARLDVGFASFQKSMEEQILASIHKAGEGAHWTQQFEVACKDNVTQELSQGLKSQLASLKQSIGKTWMALPEDEQKNAYVSQLRSAYEPVFQDITGTIDSHLQRSLKHMQMTVPRRKPLSQEELVSKCSSSIVGNILDERCYDVGGQQHLKKVSGFLQGKGKSPKNFCMPSVIEGMVRRLHDSQGLIGMTMQFEAKSLSLAPAEGAMDGILEAAGDVGKK